LLSVSSDTGEFLSARSSVTSRTLVGSDVERQRRGRPLSDDEDTTLADSIVDSMHSCLDDTLAADTTEDEVTLHEDAGADDDADFPELAHDDDGHLSPEERMHRLARRMEGELIKPI